MTFTAAAGTTYYIDVDGYAPRNGPAASGNIVLNVTLVQAPANDNFANATALTGATVQWIGSNAGATLQTGEPAIAHEPGGASVWFQWVAPSSGTVAVNTEGSKFDTLLGVYTGTAVNALTTVAQNDDVSRYDLTSAVTFTAVAGTTYYIDVDGYRGATGTVVLNLNEVQAPGNDNFANAAVITGTSAQWTGTNVGATLQSGEPRNAGVPGGASVWVAWTASASGTVTLDTHGSNFDTTLGVYTGTSVNALTCVAANDDDPAGGTLTSALTFAAVSGTTYYFSVDGYYGATGNITLNLNEILPIGGGSSSTAHGSTPTANGNAPTANGSAPTAPSGGGPIFWW